jgi:hypothetical protein
MRIISEQNILERRSPCLTSAHNEMDTPAFFFFPWAILSELLADHRNTVSWRRMPSLREE